MAGSEPLLQEADPVHLKLNVEYEYWYKMVQKKTKPVWCVENLVGLFLQLKIKIQYFHNF